MESLLPKEKGDDESNVNSSSTLEFVSSRIQKLKFNEWSAVCCYYLITFKFALDEILSVSQLFF